MQFSPERMGASPLPFSHSTMTEMNHLGLGLMTAPAKVKPLMDKLYSSVIYSNNTLTRELMQNAEVITSKDFEYKAMGNDRRPLTIVEDIMPSSDVTRGSGVNNPIRLKGDHDDFTATDYLFPEGEERFQARVRRKPAEHGNGWIYELDLSGDDIKKHVPTKYFKPGVKWSKLYAKGGEAEDQRGSTQYGTSYTLKGTMSRFEKHYVVTGDVVDEVLAVNLPTADGGMTSSWLRYAEHVFYKQWYEELEVGMWTSRYDTTTKNSAGRVVNSGAGIHEQLEESVSEKYSNLTAEVFEAFLMDVLFAKKAADQGIVIETYTGSYGILNFNKVMTDLMNRRGWIMTGGSFNPLQKVSSGFHSNSYSMGYQIVEWKLGNNITLRVKHLPMYDDPILYPKLDPTTGHPVQSQQYTFLSLSGNTSYRENIRLIKKKDAFRHGYMMGLATPWGPNRNTHGLNTTRNAFEFHMEDMCGVKIMDPTACGVLKKEVRF